MAFKRLLTSVWSATSQHFNSTIVIAKPVKQVISDVSFPEVNCVNRFQSQFSITGLHHYQTIMRKWSLHLACGHPTLRLPRRGLDSEPIYITGQCTLYQRGTRGQCPGPRAWGSEFFFKTSFLIKKYRAHHKKYYALMWYNRNNY